MDEGVGGDESVVLARYAARVKVCSLTRTYRVMSRVKELAAAGDTCRARWENQDGKLEVSYDVTRTLVESRVRVHELVLWWVRGG